MLALFVGLVPLAAAASLPDPMVGSWTPKGSRHQVRVEQDGSLYRAIRHTESKAGPCTFEAGSTIWLLAKQSDGSYKGTDFGRHWSDSSDPSTCKVLPIDATGKLGFVGGMIVLTVCYAATEDFAAGCFSYTRPDDPPTIVPISSVSNGCGGAGWSTLEHAQNYLGNTSVYKDSNVNPFANSYRVNFVAACNLHDAGYAGAAVKDTINGGVVDYRRWSRARVDNKFRSDMRTLCLRQIPAKAKIARTNCLNNGGNLSAGTLSRYRFVRKWGDLFFDANLYQPGTQHNGERLNN